MLCQQLRSASQYIEMLNNTMEDMNESQQKLREAEVDCVMQLRGEQAVKSLQAQLRAWHRYMGKEKEFLVRQGIHSWTFLAMVQPTLRVTCVIYRGLACRRSSQSRRPLT